MASPFLSHWAELENIRGDIRLPSQREKKGRVTIWTIQAGNCKCALELYWNQAFSESFSSGKDHANGYESTFDLRLIFLWIRQHDIFKVLSKQFIGYPVFNSLWIYKKSNDFMKYSYNRLIWEGFKGGFMNPTLAGPLLSGWKRWSSSSLHKILTSLTVQNFLYVRWKVSLCRCLRIGYVRNVSTNYH